MTFRCPFSLNILSNPVAATTFKYGRTGNMNLTSLWGSKENNNMYDTATTAKLLTLLSKKIPRSMNTVAPLKDFGKAEVKYQW
mmetsp:Transcript_4810/g.8508  ORF Transcript_4810/g.8508 Transcript_4810/m.8508 type:complete len:83 (+) Transcript_4810:485-733(+)